MGRFLPLLLLAGCMTPTPTSPPVHEEVYGMLDATAEMWNQAMSEPDPVMRRERLMTAESQMRNLSNRYVDILMRDLQLNSETEKRSTASFALGFCSTKRETLLPVLVAAMDDGSPLVRANAAVSVARLRPDPVPLEAYRNLLSDRSDQPRLGALFGLRMIAGDGMDITPVLPDVHARLADPHPDVRADAAALVAELRRPESVHPLIGVIHSREQDEDVLVNVAVALREIADERAVEALIDLLRNPYPLVVDAAWSALRRITGREFDRSWHTWASWWREEQSRQEPEG